MIGNADSWEKTHTTTTTQMQIDFIIQNINGDQILKITSQILIR